MESEEHATRFLGVLDTSFMITYAIVNNTFINRI